MEPTQQPQDQPLINISGEKIALGPARRDLLPLYQRWINDFEVIRTLGARLRPMTWEAEEAWYEETSKSDTLFTIYERATMRPIGNTGLHDIDHLHRTAEFGILIGEKECWGKGYGTETTRLMLDYGFNGPRLHQDSVGGEPYPPVSRAQSFDVLLQRKWFQGSRFVRESRSPRHPLPPLWS